MRRVRVDVPAGRQPIAAKTAQAGIFVARPTQESVVVLRNTPIEAHVAGVFIEWRGEGRELRKVGRVDADRRVLIRFLIVAEPEQPVLDRRAAQAEAVLFAAEIRLRRCEVRPRGEIVVAVEEEAAAVQAVAAAFGDDVDRAGRADAGGSVRRRCRNLKLLNRLLRDVERGGADVLVHRVHAVNRDAGLAAAAAADGNACVTALGRIEGAALLNLDAGLQPRELQIVSPVERQLLDLARVDDTADGRFLQFHRDGGVRDVDLHGFTGAGDFQSRLDVCSLPDGDDDAVNQEGGEAGEADAQLVFAGLQRGQQKVALIVGRGDAYCASRKRGRGGGRATNDRARRVGDDAGQIA